MSEADIQNRLKYIHGRLDSFESVNLDKIRQSLIETKGFSDRECDIFFVVGSGVNNCEAAEYLRISEGTVKFHLTSIFKKLDVNSRSKLVILAHGLEAI